MSGIRTLAALGAVAVTAAALAGCVEALSEERPPTIAHVHIGHALHGWADTPGRQGLFVVAEKEALAVKEVLGDISSSAALADMQRSMRVVRGIVDAEHRENESAPGVGYGLQRALGGAVDHIVFAARSDDASANVKQSARIFEERSKAVMERIKLLDAISLELDTITSSRDAFAFVQEAQALAEQIIHGTETDGRAPVGSAADEYGLAQLRQMLATMVDREDPAYTPAGEKWLLGLIRLPSGEWRFSNRVLSDPEAVRY